MILGLSLSTFTILHVVISLVALVAGVVVVGELLRGRNVALWTVLFLLTSGLTSITGFMFPFTTLLPSHVFGVLLLIALATAMLGFYVYGLTGAWRWLYVASTIIAFYLNAFVTVVQAFQKVPALMPLAPTQSEPPFLVAQFVLLGVVVWLGIVAARRFHPVATAAT